MIDKLIYNWLRIRECIQDHKKEIVDLKKNETELANEIIMYLKEQNETNIALDNNVKIELKNSLKTIPVSKKTYKDKIKKILYTRGIDDNNMLNEILNAKVEKVVPNENLKIKKRKMKNV